MRGKIGSFLGAAAVLHFSACGLGEPTDIEELDVVVSYRDPNTDFSALRTYAMSDTIAIIQDPENPDANRTVNTSLQTSILNQIAANMQNAGFTRLTDTNGPKPDVVMQVSAMATTSTDVYYSSWYPTWGAYYGSWYGASFGVGWYPYSVPYVTTSTIGSLIMEMTNPNAPNTAEQQIPSLWIGILNGYLEETVPVDSNRVTNGINQAFSQSPYL